MSKFKQFLKSLFPETPAGKPTFTEPNEPLDKNSDLRFKLNKTLNPIATFDTFSPVDAEAQYGKTGEFSMYLNIQVREKGKPKISTIAGSILANPESAVKLFDLDLAAHFIAISANINTYGVLKDTHLTNYATFDKDGNLELRIYPRIACVVTDDYGRRYVDYQSVHSVLVYTINVNEYKQVRDPRLANLKKVYKFRVESLK